MSYPAHMKLFFVEIPNAAVPTEQDQLHEELWQEVAGPSGQGCSHSPPTPSWYRDHSLSGGPTAPQSRGPAAPRTLSSPTEGCSYSGTTRAELLGLNYSGKKKDKPTSTVNDSLFLNHYTVDTDTYTCPPFLSLPSPAQLCHSPSETTQWGRGPCPTGAPGTPWWHLSPQEILLQPQTHCTADAKGRTGRRESSFVSRFKRAHSWVAFYLSTVSSTVSLS